jgi:hypothetical protein
MKKYEKPSLKELGLLREVTKYSQIQCEVRINSVCGRG